MKLVTRTDNERLVDLTVVNLCNAEHKIRHALLHKDSSEDVLDAALGDLQSAITMITSARDDQELWCVETSKWKRIWKILRER